MEEDDDVEVRAMFVRLKTGDDIVAELVETGDDDNFYYTVINPLKVAYVPSDSGVYLQVAFMPWVFPKICDFQQFTISFSDIMFVSHVSDYMNEYYWESVDNQLEVKEKVEEPEAEETDLYSDIVDQLLSKRTLH